MSEMRDADRDDAIAWAVRVSDPDFTDWAGLSAWLDGDSCRGDIYRRAMADVEETVDSMVAFPPSSSAVLSFRLGAKSTFHRYLRRLRWPAMGMALAAGFAGIMLTGHPATESTLRSIQTPAGQSTRIALADGSRVEMAGGGRLVISPDRPREVRLEHGRAVFTVVHDATAPFQVLAGGHRIVDVGTSFEVVQTIDMTDVAVAEGAVVVNPGRASIAIDAGRGAIFRDGAAPQLVSRRPDGIGQWRRSRMSYHEAPMTQVAADLSAVLGRPVTIGDGLRNRRFTGSLAVPAVRANPEELAQLLDVRMRNDDSGLELSAP